MEKITRLQNFVNAREDQLRDQVGEQIGISVYNKTWDLALNQVQGLWGTQIKVQVHSKVIAWKK